LEILSLRFDENPELLMKQQQNNKVFPALCFNAGTISSVSKNNK